MSNFIDYSDFLRMSDEIELNSLATELELMLIINDKNMDSYDAAKCRTKVYELLTQVDKLTDLRNRAVVHGANEVWDKCEVYIVEAEYQMRILRNKYMYGE